MPPDVSVKPVKFVESYEPDHAWKSCQNPPVRVGMPTGNPSSRYSAGEPGNGCPILFLEKEEKC
jgi:hypothetical protein